MRPQSQEGSVLSKSWRSPAYIMSFPGTISAEAQASDKPCHVLIDTGATHNFVDAKFAKSLGIQIIQDESTVLCGGNTAVRIEGYVNLKLTLHSASVKQVLRFYVTILPEPLTVVLGQGWMSDSQAVMDYANRVLTFYKGLKRVKCRSTYTGAALFHSLRGETEQNLESILFLGRSSKTK